MRLSQPQTRSPQLRGPPVPGRPVPGPAAWSRGGVQRPWAPALPARAPAVTPWFSSLRPAMWTAQSAGGLHGPARRRAWPGSENPCPAATVDGAPLQPDSLLPPTTHLCGQVNSRHPLTPVYSSGNRECLCRCLASAGPGRAQERLAVLRSGPRGVRQAWALGSLPGTDLVVRVQSPGGGAPPAGGALATVCV